MSSIESNLIELHCLSSDELACGAATVVDAVGFGLEFTGAVPIVPLLTTVPTWNGLPGVVDGPEDVLGDNGLRAVVSTQPGICCDGTPLPVITG